MLACGQCAVLTLGPAQNHVDLESSDVKFVQELIHRTHTCGRAARVCVAVGDPATP